MARVSQARVSQADLSRVPPKREKGPNLGIYGMPWRFPRYGKCTTAFAGPAAGWGHNDDWGLDWRRTAYRGLCGEPFPKCTPKSWYAEEGS